MKILIFLSITSLLLNKVYRMERSRIVVALALALSLISVIVGIAGIGLSGKGSRFTTTAETFFSSGRAGIALIEVRGVISDRGGRDSASADRLVRQIEDARDESAVRAILLSINSPGGSVGATKRIYDALIDVRKKKPVIAIISDMAASGGYYIASASDKIFAYEGSILGSIGVISLHLDISEFIQKYGIKFNAIKAGRYKDSSYPFRAMTEEELRMHQSAINDAYNQFLRDVADGRKEPVSRVTEEWAEGRIFSGREAKTLQMIDEIGGKDRAIAAIKEMLKTDQDLPIFAEERDFWQDFFQDMPFGRAAGREEMLLSPAMYLYPSGGAFMKIMDPFASAWNHSGN